MVSLELFTDNLFGRTIAIGSTQLLTEANTRRPKRRADNLTTFMCRISEDLGASTSWNPQGQYRVALPFTIISTPSEIGMLLLLLLLGTDVPQSA